MFSKNRQHNRLNDAPWHADVHLLLEQGLLSTVLTISTAPTGHWCNSTMPAGENQSPTAQCQDPAIDNLCKSAKEIGVAMFQVHTVMT